ncbi:hypothetical protein DMUE_4235 [Dictyocoela muelleri]|nr:hypothetical protein DMUE_4235 [Dictyocoela muelleri]
MRPYKNLTNIGAPELGKYLRSEAFAFQILKRLGVIKSQKYCPHCKCLMKIHGGHDGFFYCKRKCNIRLSMRYDTILQDTRITFRKFLLLCHYYFHKTIITKNLLRDVGISRSLITKIKYKIEHKIALYNNRCMVKLGGEGSIVEADETLMASAKYGKGRYPMQTWVFGVVERETGRCYLKVVPNRKKSTLENIISNIIVESTIICTDQAKMYGSLDELGFIHFDVCHKKNFVDPQTRAHTQTIESLWNHFKKKKHMEYGIAKKRLQAYCEVFSFFRNNRNLSFEDFMKIL